MIDGHAERVVPGVTTAADRSPDHCAREVETTAPPASVQAALRLINSGVDALLALNDHEELGCLDLPSLAASIRAFEETRNRLASVDHALLNAAARGHLEQFTGARSTAHALAQITRVTRAEAKKRLQAAGMVAPIITLGGERLPSRLPATADAQRRGDVSAGQARVIGACIRDLDVATVQDDACRDAEAALVQYCAAFNPAELRTIANTIMDVLVPDGKPPRDALVRARRGVTAGTERSDGSCTISGVLTKTLRAKLHATLSPLAAPKPAHNGIGDDRTHVQRMHDALEDLCDRHLRTGELPGSNGARAGVMIIAQLDDLMEHLRQHAQGLEFPVARSTDSPSFRTSDGRVLSFAEFRTLADNAEAIPAFMSNTDGIVAYGRDRRYATPQQWNALIARDRGCSFPGCDAPPQWCEAHHVVPWLLGGNTDLDNLALVCGYHHREFESQGWECRMIRGLPHWLPPSWIDRAPLQNHEHATRPLHPQQVTSALNDAYRVAEQDEELQERASVATARLGPRRVHIITALHDRQINNAITSWIEHALTTRLNQ